MTQDDDAQRLRDAMYGEINLGAFSLFSGGFINYGYWNVIPNGPISAAERTESQAELYRRVVAQLNVGDSDHLLELGSGIGAGAALVAEHFGPRKLSCLDRSPEQLERAEANTVEVRRRYPDRVEFRQGSMTDIPWPAETFNGVYSVEALQHVDDLDATAREVSRVLVPGGRFSTATFFEPDEAPSSVEPELLETVDSGVDVLRPVGEFAAALQNAGLDEVSVTSLGDHVWVGMDRWIAQTEYADSWGRNWLRAWHSGWVDYFLITAHKPT
ncbi:methyltransferase family protein [Stackebrandtia endophytica]|uniref:Methyltransferase family protein n=1 Tax=Stackebrandtia endophytica TaxID=1496996 RepID=A0A543B1Q7_9ACTN|nr:class I SAM-dependent methyltransferase [Stackebrandtia endophytica]TQL78751.1 methyltransferase family protein [Stackebrandtia endophytica]